MLSSVLRSERAVQVNIVIVRAFVRLRQLLATHKDLARKIETLERKDAEHDAKFRDHTSVVPSSVSASEHTMAAFEQELRKLGSETNAELIVRGNGPLTRRLRR